MICVITGDIINSRKANEPGEFLNPLKKELDNYGQSPKSWEIFRGDSFQAEIRDPLLALESAIKIKAIIKLNKELDVRMAIGIGNKTYDAGRITESNGEAFVNSGKTFDQVLKKDVTLAVKSPWPDFDRRMNLLIKMALSFMNNWSHKASEIVLLSLQNPGLSQAELGKLVNRKQHTISDRLERANFHLVVEMIEEYKSELEKLLKTGKDS